MRTRGVITVIVVGSMIAAACGGGKKEAKSDVPTSTSETTATTAATTETSSAAAPAAIAANTTALATTTTAKPSSSAKKVITATGKGNSALPPTQAPRSEVISTPTTVPQGEPPQPGGTLTAMVGFEGSGYDPARFSNASVSGDMHRLFAVYDALVYADPTTGSVQPELATAVTTSDAIVWTIKIRTNVKFTDGTAFDAQAV